MGKMKINFSRGVFLFCMFLTNHVHTQDLFTKELNWIVNDTTANIAFQDTNQILEWGKSLGTSVEYKTIVIKNSDIFILIPDKCSGLYCPSFYVFVEKDKTWQLIATSHATLRERIEMEAKDDKIIFKTKSGQIGELRF